MSMVVQKASRFRIIVKSYLKTHH